MSESVNDYVHDTAPHASPLLRSTTKPQEVPRSKMSQSGVFSKNARKMARQGSSKRLRKEAMGTGNISLPDILNKS